MMQVHQLEMQAVQYYLYQTPYEAPMFADWPDNGFVALDADAKL
jgi:hypothetical protein